MNLNVLRYRARPEEEWRTWKFNPTSGRLRSYLYIGAPRQDLAEIAAGLVYALTGTCAPNKVHEVALQLSDDGGHTWVVQRRGNTSRVMRDGVALAPGDGETALAAALFDHEQPLQSNAEVAQFDVQSIADELRILPLGPSAEGAAAHSVKDIAQQQMRMLAGKCADSFKLPQLAEPRLITQLAGKLAPLHIQYHELARQFQDLKEETQGFVATETPQVAALASELELLDKLADIAVPLLQPGVTLKSLKDDLAKVDGDVADLCSSMGVDASEGKVPPCDFRSAIAVLSRLEAYSRLIHATQDARRYYQEHLEPAHQRYVRLAENGIASDRQVASELEQCLASLQVRLRQRNVKATSHGEDSIKPKTWFERLKAKPGDVEQAPEDNVVDAQVAADLETAEMAISYALKRVKELNNGLDVARRQHDSALAAIDKAHEDLVRSYGKVRDQWLATARKSTLPEDLDLNKLLIIAGKHGKLSALTDKRIDLMQKLQRFSANLVKSERLVRDWRQLTGSQNASDLSSPNILLGEVQGLLRYRDNKRKRFEQLKGAAAEVKASASLRELLKARRKMLLATWRNAFDDTGIPVFPIHDDRCPELLKTATIIEALTMVHVSYEPTERKLEIAEQSEAVLSIYLWDEEKSVQKHRLAMLNAIDESTPAEPRIFLVADLDFAAMLGPAGLGRGQLIEKPIPATASANVTGATPTARTQSVVKQPATIAAQTPNTQVNIGTIAPAVNPMLSDRARRALETLTVKR